MEKKTLVKIGKILGIPLSFRKPKTTQEIEEILKLHNKYKDFCNIIDFLNKTKRENISSFMFKIKNIVQNHIESQSFYKNVTTKKIQSRDFETKVKSFYIDSSDQKYFLSIDIKTANFTCLKRLARKEIIQEKWSDYLRFLVPNDERSNSKYNQESGTAGIIFEIPSCIYESKFFRQFVLGNLVKLKYEWEFLNLELLNKFLELKLNNKVCVGSDELIIEVVDYDEADKIVNLLSPDPNIFRITNFQLKKIEGGRKNNLLKICSNGNIGLINVIPDDYHELYKRYCCWLFIFISKINESKIYRYFFLD
jgi:hypothetical protein